MNTKFLIYFLLLNHTIVLSQTPFLKTIAWNSAFGERFNQRIQPAQDGNLWAMASAADAQATTNGGRILKLSLGGQVLQSLRFEQKSRATSESRYLHPIPLKIGTPAASCYLAQSPVKTQNQAFPTTV
jgi:hypothetical protein